MTPDAAETGHNTNTSDDELADYHQIANDTLGIDLAEQVRELIDQAIINLAGQTPPADDPGVLVEQALTAVGLTIYRRPNQTGYGIGPRLLRAVSATAHTNHSSEILNGVIRRRQSPGPSVC